MDLGYSDVPADMDLSPINQGKMIVAFMNALSVGRADVISNDSGTGVAQLLAVHHPLRVRSLLLTNGDVNKDSPPPRLMPTILEARRGDLIKRLERQVRHPTIAQSSAYTNPKFVNPEMVHVCLDPLVSSVKRRMQCQQYGAAFLPSSLPSIAPALRSLDIPARMVWGTGDDLFTRHCAVWLDRTLPHSLGVRYVAGAKLFFPKNFQKSSRPKPTTCAGWGFRRPGSRLGPAGERHFLLPYAVTL